MSSEDEFSIYEMKYKNKQGISNSKPSKLAIKSSSPTGNMGMHAVQNSVVNSERSLCSSSVE